MNVNKEKLKEAFKNGDWDEVFKCANIIADFLCSKHFKIYNLDDREDIVQECLLNFHKKIIEGKVDENNNIFSFIWANSRFRILEILRKDRKRKEKASFISFDNLENCFYTEDEICLDNVYEEPIEVAV